MQIRTNGIDKLPVGYTGLVFVDYEGHRGWTVGRIANNAVDRRSGYGNYWQWFRWYGRYGYGECSYICPGRETVLAWMPMPEAPKE